MRYMNIGRVVALVVLLAMGGLSSTNVMVARANALDRKSVV